MSKQHCGRQKQNSNWKRGLPIVAGIMIAFITLSACERSYDEQADELANFARNNKMGFSQDYWLVSRSSLGFEDPVALIFGMGDDLLFCEELAELYMQKYSRATYYCVATSL